MEIHFMARTDRTIGIKHVSKSTATVKGHMNHQRMHARSTQIKKEGKCKSETETALKQPYTAD
jgi:hypothetical protein